MESRGRKRSQAWDSPQPEPGPLPPGAAPTPRAGTHWYRLLPCCRFWPSLARLGLGSLAMSKSEGRERRGMSSGKKRGCQHPTPRGCVSSTGFLGAPGHAPLPAGDVPLQSIHRASPRLPALSRFKFSGKDRSSPGLCRDMEPLRLSLQQSLPVGAPSPGACAQPRPGRLQLGWQKAPLVMNVINPQRHFPPLW